MSGIVQSLVAPTSSIVASTNPSVNSQNNQSQQNNTIANSSATGQAAAVVNFSASSKTRAASSGEQRQVDAGFEKQDVKSRDKKKEDGEGGSSNDSVGNTLNVEA